MASSEDLVENAGEGSIAKKGYRDLNLLRWSIPDNLVAAGVIEDEWGKIHDMTYDKLLPSLRETEVPDHRLRQLFDYYVGGEMIGGVVGFGKEVRILLHDSKKVLHIRTDVLIS